MKYGALLIARGDLTPQGFGTLAASIPKGQNIHATAESSFFSSFLGR
jgi:hypothetical protein